MMLKLKNIFRKSSQSIVKLTIALKALIGTIATASYIQDKPDLAFWLLVGGAALDFFLQMLPEDTKLKGTKTLLLIVGLVAAVSVLSGCKILRPATDNSLIDTSYTNYKNIDVPVKGAKVNQVINHDSLFGAWLTKYKQFQKDSTTAVNTGKPIPEKPQLPAKTVTDPETKALLTYWIDQNGKLQVSCESKDQTIQMLVAENTRMRTEKSKVTEIVKETPVWNWIAMSVLATLLLVSLLVNVFKTRLK